MDQLALKIFLTLQGIGSSVLDNETSRTLALELNETVMNEAAHRLQFESSPATFLSLIRNPRAMS